MPFELPAKASVVVIGAGAVGMACAWQLAKRGVRDVVVLDKSGITHGSTWHAAGLVGQFRSREDLTRLMRSSVAILDEIEAETPIDWRRVGSLRLASSAARWTELRAGAEQAKRYGVAYDLVDAAEAKRRFPLITSKGVEGAAWIAGDGYVDPSALTFAYAARARKLGVQVAEGTTVTGIARSGARVTSITTDRGLIACEALILAAGVWARAVGAMMDLALPVAALEHQYAITEKHADIGRDLPALRDPDLNFYVKPDVGALAIGGWEAATIPVYDSAMPSAFGRELLPQNLDRLQPILEAAISRIPLVGNLGLKTVINGPIPVSPDGEPILGPAPGLDNVMLAVGFTSGIAASGGAGQAVAEWIADGRPSFALPSLDPRRFGPNAGTSAELHRAAISAYAAYYALARDAAAG
jgi:glycine/D-amino acid oxidase-like deaminating enzyme